MDGNNKENKITPPDHCPFALLAGHALHPVQDMNTFNFDQGKPDMRYRLLKPMEVDSLLRISRSFAYQLMQTGAIPVMRIGTACRVRQQDLEEYIQKNIHFFMETYAFHRFPDLAAFYEINIDQIHSFGNILILTIKHFRSSTGKNQLYAIFLKMGLNKSR